VTIALRSSSDLWTAATRHLRGAPERVMFLAATGDQPVTIADSLFVDDEDLEPGPFCVHLTERAQQRVLRWAAVVDGWIIEMHSHLGAYGDPARMSPTDVSGLGEWVPHVRWRLQQRPYAALVLGPHTLDGVAWTGEKDAPPIAIKAWDVDGTTMVTTGLSLASFAPPT